MELTEKDPLLPRTIYKQTPSSHAEGSISPPPRGEPLTLPLILNPHHRPAAPSPVAAETAEETEEEGLLTAEEVIPLLSETAAASSVSLPPDEAETPRSSKTKTMMGILADKNSDLLGTLDRVLLHSILAEYFETSDLPPRRQIVFKKTWSGDIKISFGDFLYKKIEKYRLPFLGSDILFVRDEAGGIFEEGRYERIPSLREEFRLVHGQRSLNNKTITEKGTFAYIPELGTMELIFGTRIGRDGCSHRSHFAYNPDTGQMELQ